MGRRGSVAMAFAVAGIPVAIATGVAIDFSRIADGRSALQRAVDSAALSGAAAYVLYTTGDAYNAVAVTVATSAFCNAAAALPANMTLVATTGSKTCNTTAGPSVAAVIAGYKTGTPGITPASGCSATSTIVAGVKCGFVVTVSASATMNTIFVNLFSASNTIRLTAVAANPFINLATALTPKLLGSATYANSLWVYPLLLDANGNPDFVSNAGALPSTAGCTGAPNQTVCGVYTMLASNKYASCTAAAPCTVGTTVFGGTGGIVQNPSVGSAVITATTPLGIAFATAAGGNGSYGYYPVNSYSYQTPIKAPNGCVWPGLVAYNTVNQVYDDKGNPVVVDKNGNWLPTHWFYSSYLANNKPPSYGEIALQLNTAINPSTGLAYNAQDVASTPQVIAATPPATGNVNSPSGCSNPNATTNHMYPVTTYPAVGNTNCSLYIVRDPTVYTPDATYKGSGKCFDPANTPGQQYSALSCQSYAGHTFAFFWNDMGGRIVDDTDYGNGTLIVNCSGSTSVLLIN